MLKRWTTKCAVEAMPCSSNVNMMTASMHRHVVGSAHLLYRLKKLLLVGIASLHRLIKSLQGI